MALPGPSYEEIASLTIHTDPSGMDTFLRDWIADASEGLDKLRIESMLDADGFEKQLLEPGTGLPEPLALPESLGPELEENEVLLPDATVLVEGPEGDWEEGTSGTVAWAEEPVLSLVSLNPRTSNTFDLVRGSLTVLPELPGSSVAVRTVRVSVGRDPVNTVVLSDSRVSHVHFTLRVRAARGGYVTLELLDQSSNGTWVNGRKVGRGRSVPMAVGDQILVLPACHVGRESEVGFLLLHDARGARCGGGQEHAKSMPPSPRDISVPRELEKDLQCGICTDALFRCLTLVPCGHNFCTACLVKWRRRSYACPECRETVQQAVRNASIDRVVETYLLAHPEAARSEQEVKAMESAEQDPNNTAMLRWLTRPAPTWTVQSTQHEAREVATPMRRVQERERPESYRVQHARIHRDAASSSACVVS